MELLSLSLLPHPDSMETHQRPSSVYFGHFGWRKGVGITLWYSVPLSLSVGGVMSVRGLTHSILDPLMLSEKLEPRGLDSWVPVRILPAEVCAPTLVTRAGLWWPSNKNFCGLTRRETLCHRSWGNWPRYKSWL